MGMIIVIRGNKDARRPPPGDGASPWSSGSDDAMLADAIRRVPCGAGACGVTCLGSRCKPCVCACPLLERVRPLLLLSPKKTKKHNHPTPILTWVMADCAFRSPRGSSFARITSEAHI